MSESFVLGTAQDREDACRERCQRKDALVGELELLEEGLPTFVAEVGADPLSSMVKALELLRTAASTVQERDRFVEAALSAAAKFHCCHIAKLGQLAVQQEAVERVEAELEGLQ